MSLAIRELTPGFVGEVSGVDITEPLTSEQVAALEAGMDRYAVLVYHGQEFTDDQQKRFSRYFGSLEATAGGNVTKDKDRRLDADMADVSNLGADHKPLARDDRRRLFNLGNQLWHSDSSFRAVPAKYSLLSGRTVVDKGGNTEFADMRAAYDALDAATKTEIEHLVCEHSLIYSRGTLGFTE
ncbi:MAG TPA: TauD/TfdA family dioxygenase, partial [Rhodopila sp.]|uniref:TauD/TfdA dioxygenase family protein n=1 Tax=Rhodopila sp. TaxID=2480087 RepID=UPI002CCE24E5